MEEVPPDKKASLVINHFLSVPHFLQCNDIPNEQETNEIKALLLELTNEIQHIGDKLSTLQGRIYRPFQWTYHDVPAITPLRDKINILQHRYNARVERVNLYQMPLTAGRRIPNKILQEIFYHCLPDERNPVMDMTKAPLLLTIVCRRWRILAHHTSGLWTTFHIPFIQFRCLNPHLPVTFTHAKWAEHLLLRWLGRTGLLLPLSFSLVFDLRSHPVQVRDNRTIDICFQMLLPLVSLWKNVRFEGIRELLSTLFIPSSGDFKSLESLFLAFYDGTQIPPAPIFNAPNLRKISIQCGDLNPIALNFPWDRLTHLDLALPRTQDWAVPPDLGALSVVLNQCTLLIYLGVDVGHGEFIRQFYLPKLRRLSLRSTSQSYPDTMFVENLWAPALYHVSLVGLSTNGIVSLLSRHGRVLHKLDLNRCGQNGSLRGYRDALRHCPYLHSLSILGRSTHQGCALETEKEFFSIFTGTGEDEAPICPVLQELLFYNVDCMSLRALVSFLEIKQYGDPAVFFPLRKLSTDGLIGDHEKGYQIVFSKGQLLQNDLKPFVDQGLVFEMWDSNDKSRPSSPKVVKNYKPPG